jgi:glutaredoxin
MIYNELSTAYSQIENMIASSDPAINEKLSNLANYIHENGQAIQDDLMKHRDHLPLIQKMGRIEKIHNVCALLELKVLLQGDDNAQLAEWVLKNKEGVSSENSQELFHDLSKARERLLNAKLLVPDVGTALSNMVTFGLGLKGQKNVEQVRTVNGSLEALAHWINSEKIPLKSAGLSPSELKAIAPYLHYVNCVDFALDDPQTFVTSCYNAYHLLVSGTRIVELKQLPPQLQTLECILCKNLTAIDLSNSKELLSLQCSFAPIAALDISHNPLLQSLNCNHCLISKLDISQNPQLQKLDCSYCKNLTALDTSHNPQLQKLDCSKSPILALNLSHNLQLQTLNCSESPIIALDVSHNKQLQMLVCDCCPISTLNVSHNPQLEELYCTSCSIESLDLTHNTKLETLSCSGTSISALDLSNNPLLKNFYCKFCPISTLDFSNNLQLLRVNCNHCQRLTSLGAALPNTLDSLYCEDCPNLSQLPQLPHTATVYSGNSRCGDLHTFKVYPADLEEKPKQVLLDLGKILLQNKPFPNIVYMDPRTDLPTAGLDAGGLRRQLVSTLCENLFKKGSGFPFLEEAGYQTPTLSEGENPDALRTFARLLGLAATSSLLTGTNLDPRFFETLFTLTDQELNQPLSEDLKKKLYMARQGLSLESFTKEDEKGMAEESGILRATAIAAKELKTTLGKGFRKQNIKEFIVNVQGIPITKEKLKANIHCNNRNYKLWIDKFIDKLPLTVGKQTYELKHLLMLFTGYYSLGGGPITINVFPNRKYLDSSTVIHTCYQTMELPGDLTEDLLKKELMAQLALLKSFNTA